MEITVKAFKDLQDGFLLLDVREEWEIEKVALAGATHCPMGDLVSHVEDFPRDQKIYILCHHGVRSLKAALYLQNQGFDAVSIKGGIDAYAREVDPEIGFY